MVDIEGVEKERGEEREEKGREKGRRKKRVPSRSANAFRRRLNCA